MRFRNGFVSPTKTMMSLAVAKSTTPIDFFFKEDVEGTAPIRASENIRRTQDKNA